MADIFNRRLTQRKETGNEHVGGKCPDDSSEGQALWISSLKEGADGHAVTIYRDPSPQLVELVNAQKGVNVKWYSVLKGLES